MSNPSLRVILLAPHPLLDLNFLNAATPGGLTLSGGANGTRVTATGILASSACPRFDYDPVSMACKGMLIEETRTNIAPNSDSFNAWAAGAHSSITANAATAPDGTSTADKLVTDALSGAHYITPAAVAMDIGAVYTYSVSAKAGGYDFCFLQGVATGGYPKSYFNLPTGVVSSQGAGHTAVIQNFRNAWNRCAITYTADDTNGSLLALGVSADSGVESFTGDGISGIYLWGGQVEAGPFCTSHIPTGAAPVTRSADIATFAWTQADGTYAVEFDLNAVTGTRPILSLDDGTADNQIRLYASGTSLKLTVTTGGVTQADLTLGTVAASTTYKAAFSIRANEFLALMSGGTLQSDLAGAVPVVTTGRIGSDFAGNYQNGHSKRIRQWKQRKNLWPLVA
jgi:hypothetical protein